MKQSNDDNNNDKNDINDDNNNIESYNDANKLPSMVLMTINLGYGSYLGYKHLAMKKCICKEFLRISNKPD
jgi:hypothetical protein